jgi:RNA polymerase sigma-70 factor (ECF subfamily)
MIESSIGEESSPTRASLIRRLKDWGDQTGWQEFFETYWRLIYGTARRAGLSDAEAQDVVQETVITVAKVIPTFDYDPAKGSFKGWLRNTTQWRIKDHLRRRARLPAPVQDDEDDSETPVLQRVVDPSISEQDAAWDAEWEDNLLDVAVKNVKKKVKPKQYQLFELFVLRRWPMREITHKMRVSMGQVYFAKVKVGSLVQKEVRELQRKWK